MRDRGWRKNRERGMLRVELERPLHERMGRALSIGKSWKQRGVPRQAAKAWGMGGRGGEEFLGWFLFGGGGGGGWGASGKKGFLTRRGQAKQGRKASSLKRHTKLHRGCRKGAQGTITDRLTGGGEGLARITSSVWKDTFRGEMVRLEEGKN